VAGLRTSQFVPGRQTVFGQGPNTISALIGLGAVALIGMAYGKANVRPRTKFVAWTGFLIIAAAVTRTGSRGALVGMGAGLLTLIASQGSARTRLRNAVIVVLALGACAWITLTSAATANRWEKTLEEGNVAGRDRIFRSAFLMFEERPIMGWGPVTNIYELGQRRGTIKRDTHNLLLWLMTELGVVGTLPFCIGVFLSARAAWRGRRGSLGLVPLSLLATVLAVNMAGTYYVTKWFWLVMACALASETYVTGRRSRRALPVPGGPRRGGVPRLAGGARTAPIRAGVPTRGIRLGPIS